MTGSYETERSGEDRDRLGHNPEVAGSNPVPATSGNDPRGVISGVVFMADGHVFGHISYVNELTGPYLCRPDLTLLPI
jgi:hypothetical protein